MRRAMLILLVLLLTAGCGPASTAAKVYPAQDALRAWHDHGLNATLTPSGGTPTNGIRETWIVNPPQFSGVKFMLLDVAESPAAAQAIIERGGGGPALGKKWRQGNLILHYGDETAQPYITALGDLR